ncbi:methyl-CpG-binding domain protein 6-like isoform X4 [Grus americana]|uniref:methyl-CpG-binding domain protein 6-like isoform X4 n=1 Tax=Grus americana TaxID=9117 RepID=UPI002407DD39|nr:methyl-CpG-binding domain protein 6-like isoform X4 [Grus americana]
MQRGGTMSSSDDSTGTEQPMCPSAGPVPVGWERKVEEGSVCYISPSGTTLTSLEQTCAYLLADGTCKCGLERPLNTHKVFNFDPGAMVAGRGAPGAQGQQDMTKLCNHRWKAMAMATLYHSMEGTLGPCHPGTGNLLALSPLLQNRPLLPSTLPPLGLSLGPGQGPPQGTTSPLAGLLQSLQGSSLHLRPSCRGWRKVASTPQPSACLETLQQRGLSASPGASPTADLAAARGPWPGRPVKNCRRKLLT